MRLQAAAGGERAAHRDLFGLGGRRGDFSKAAQPGDYVEERIVDDMRDVLPPAKMERGFLQVGEPYSHEFDPETGHWRGTFPTFVKEGQNWKYCGNCFIGKTTPPPAPIRR